MHRAVRLTRKVVQVTCEAGAAAQSSRHLLPCNAFDCEPERLEVVEDVHFSSLGEVVGNLMRYLSHLRAGYTLKELSIG